MDSFLSRLQEDIKCSLCNQRLTEPKLLPCFHTFCKACIQTHAQLDKDQIHIFKCPKCSSETSFQDLCSDLEELQSSPLHSRRLQVLTFAESEKSCSVSEAHSSAIWQCLDCDRSLCDDCLKSHSTFIKDHQVVSLSDLTKEDFESLLRRESSCKTHINHFFEFFCQECNILICPICLKDHKEHKTLTLHEFTIAEKDLMSKTIEEIVKLQLNEVGKKHQEEIAMKMKSDGEEAKKEVQKCTKKLVKFLLDQEQQLLNQIESSLAKAERNLRIIRHIPAAQEYIENILDNGIASDMMVNDPSLKPIFQPFDKESAGIVFNFNEGCCYQDTSKCQLGKVQLIFKSNPRLSSIQADSQLMAMTKAKLSIFTKDSTGQLNYDECDDVDVKFSPVDNVEVVQNTTKTDGNIEVEFMPLVPGQLTVEVQLNGNPVSNSPFVKNVRPQHIKEIGEHSTLKNALMTGSKNVPGVAVNTTNSRIAVADYDLHCVRVFSMDGELLMMYGTQGSEPGQLNNPEQIAFLNDIDLVIAEFKNHRVSIIDTSTGTLVRTIGCHGNGNGEFVNPSGVHVDDDCNIIVTDNGNSRVQVFTEDGTYLYQFTVPNQNNFKPVATVKHNGLFYVSDSNNGVIHVIQMNDGSPTRLTIIGERGYAADQLLYPCGLVIDSDNNLLVCASNSYSVKKFTLDGRFVGMSSKLMETPLYIAVLKNGQIICTCWKNKVVFFKSNNSS